MSDQNLSKVLQLKVLLIQKVQETENVILLEEALRVLELEDEDLLEPPVIASDPTGDKGPAT